MFNYVRLNSKELLLLLKLVTDAKQDKKTRALKGRIIDELLKRGDVSANEVARISVSA